MRTITPVRVRQFLSPALITLVALLVALYALTPPATARAIGHQVQTPFAGISPFGIGGDYHTGLTVQALSQWIPQMQAIGIHVMRCCYANEMAYLTAHRMQFGGLLYGVPPGDTKDRPGTLPVNNLRAWSQWVTRTVRAAHGKVKYWEVWNEPPNGTGRHQTPADYAKILIAAYNAAKAVDPHCKIGMAAKSVDVSYLEQVIKAGGKNHFNYITLHPYEVLGCAVDHGQDAVYMHMVPTVRKMLAAIDPAQVNVPVWLTEVGYNSVPSPARQADALVQAYAMGIAQGITCINWFEGMDGDSGPMGVLTAKLTPRPAYTAMAQMIKYMGQHPVYLGWVLLAGKDYGFVFQGAHTTVLSAWAPLHTTNPVRFGRAVEIVHPLTGATTKARSFSLGSTPILVVHVPGAVVREARKNKFKPLPWEGSYARAKSVSIT
ncbi:MAG: hypothetical protein HKL95_08280, partial [Phycisphaerae bacterium]|nr:hypothetical protein [Phycisphaerae bacterium]